ncbi:2-methylcitrate synthase/citrate synthase II [Beutenbergia cavernae DSM 12333]|uniref:Citrate synthase n=1 Tax=Beutenbergia cavernae (strain ATCC BAA-8 / DSM 12333 / CCUG 43141 / JCM 11478 / NBRC 16432 / NCIMB 13614 / HKI 0122) TaxID=471853 RepID=C5BXU3_BEUC1|nr:bifunctional 2-methylcitrate synthase/citrate synthase [Beutenbergia cavernae]ACQ78837.1 2-methylcitrate synthase/citrate synthase II [Beutenbergia cavernae DSM 12333]
MTDADPQAKEIHKGLAGVVVDTTSISKVDPDTNSLLYRGYPVQDLAARVSFEEVAYLLWHGELPTPDELQAQNATERLQRDLDPDVRDAILALPTTAHPMDVVRTAVSVLGATDPDAENLDPDALQAASLRLFAQLPAIVALDQRRRLDLPEVAPRADLGWCEHLLYLTFGQVPDAVVVDAFSVSMTLYAEHSFNASTFTARVIASTLSDLYSAVTGAVGALKGPLHGGANEAVMRTFAEIGTADDAAGWLADRLAAKGKVMGFGHRVYKHGDSRVPTMREALVRMVDHTGRTELMALYAALEDAMAERTGILPNLDYPAGPAYHLMGFETATFTPLFVASRVTGWTAHIMEQLASNALIRPLSEYVGPERREVPERP